MQQLEGREIGGCKLIRKIGEGGMGEVYLGEQLRVGNRLVAVKLVRPDDASFSVTVTEDIARRFQREAALLGQFSHPNILPVHDSGVEDGLLYLVMQFAREGSLADAIRGRGPQKLDLPASVPVVADLIAQVARALQYTHDRGVVHRDVKPGNVLVRVEPDGHWHVLLADFGVARAQATTSQRTQVTGTFAYMAPEQFSGKFSPASDQYALAIMAFQLLAGRTPFEGDIGSLTRAHLFEPPPSLCALNPLVPRAVERVVTRALAKEPAARYPSVTAFAQALEDAACEPVIRGTTTVVPPPLPQMSERQAPVPVVAPPSPPNAPSIASTAPYRSVRRSPLWRTWVVALAAVVLLASVVGAGGYLAHRQQQSDDAAALRASSATATAQAAAATQTATAATATASAVPVIVTASATAPASTDMSAPPPPPTGAGQLIVADPAPACDAAPAGVSWITDTKTTITCPTDGGVQIAAQSSNLLGCLEDQQASIASGYLSTLVAPTAGGVVLAVRESKGQSTASAGTFNVTGYYVKLDPTNNTYVIYTIDSNGKSTVLAQSTIGAGLAKHIALGVLFTGSQLAVYINGQRVGAASDSTYSIGWVGICTEGQATFSDTQAYQAGS